MTDRRLGWLPAVLFILTVIAIFYRLLAGEVLFWGLPSLQFYPWREFAMSEIRQGRLPLWNPYNGAGAPLLANYQSALLYPPHLLYFLLPGPGTMSILGILHLLWAGLGMWWFTRRLGLPVLGRGIAMLSYPLSTTLVARFGTLPMIDVAAWLPWLLLATDAMIDQPGLRPLLGLTGVIAMQLLAGHAQWTFYSLALAGSYGLWRIVITWRAGRARNDSPQTGGHLGPAPRIILLSMVAIFLAVGMAGAQLFPTAELQHQSQRSVGVDEDYALNFSFAPISLFTMFNPFFFGNPGDGTYQIPNLLYYEAAAYIGFLPLTLAILVSVRYLLGLIRRGRQKQPNPEMQSPHSLIPFFLIVTLISLILAFGKYEVIYVLLYRYVPTFNMFQAPARWLLLTVFSLIMLAGLATPHWIPARRGSFGAWLAVIVSGALVVAGLILQGMFKNAPAISVQLVSGTATIGILLLITALLFALQPKDKRYRTPWLIVVLIFVALDLWWADRLLNPTTTADFYTQQPAPMPNARTFWTDDTGKANLSLPQFAFDRFLPPKDYRVTVTLQAEYRRSGLPDLNLLDRQPSLNSFDPLRPEGFERFIRLLTTAPTPALLRAGGVGRVYDGAGQVISSFENATVPRVWIANQVKVVQSPEEAEKVMMATDWSPEQSVVIERPQSLPGYQSSIEDTATIIEETPTELTISTYAPFSSPRLIPMTLVIADTYYPGWEATVDGAPATIYRANLAFRALVLLEGKHTVHLIYHPTSFLIGSLVSLVSLILTVALLGVIVVRRIRLSKTTLE